MKLLRKLVLGVVATGIIVTGCSNPAKKMTKATEVRYVSLQVSGDVILKDSVAGISWTNSDKGCKPIASGTPAEIAKNANNFCSSLSFGGHSDWRLGTVAEVTTLEKETDAQGLKLFYKNPMCQRVFAKKSDNTLTSVSTTKNGPVARVLGLKTPAGTRCVRKDG